MSTPPPPPPPKKTAVDWSALPGDAIDFIAGRLPTNSDHVRLRSVCTSWRSSAAKRPLPPFLLLLHSHSTLLLYTFPSLTIFLPHSTPPPHFRCTASHGWAAFLSHTIILFNPFTSTQIALPSTNNFNSFTLDKLVLSADPVRNEDNSLAMVLCCNRSRLIYCRVGSSSSSSTTTTTWTQLSSHSYGQYFFQDIVFCNGRFYAVSKYRVFVCDIDHDGDDRVIEILPADPLFSDGRDVDDPGVPINRVNSYLVESCGDLLLVAISFDREREYFTNHEVFRIDVDDGKLRLVKLDTIRGRALFVGRDSMSLPSGDSHWCRANCIYYVDVKRDRIRLFNMEDESARSVTSLNGGIRGAHWILPTF